jgi:hypothetical protein
MRPVPIRALGTVAVAAAAMLAAAGTAAAHKPSDAYLTLQVAGDELAGRWDIALRDLEHAIGLDGDGDGAITWGEVQARHAAIASHALARLRLVADGVACPAAAGAQQIVAHSDGAYTVLAFRARCAAAPRRLEVDYQLFFDVDPQHRGLVRVETGGDAGHTLILRADAPRGEVTVAASARLATLVGFVGEGVRHIWIGIDHILFLIALLLPAVLARRDGRWQAATRFRPVAVEVLKVVTAFTIAHSITLVLSALGVVQLPSRLVETGIAVSVVLAALNNVVPVIDARWGVAFGLGLLHGFGFSSVLADLGLPRGETALALLGFNAGVELGQLAIVVAFLPVAFVLRESWAYRRLTVVGGSVAIAGLALMWSWERLMGAG